MSSMHSSEVKANIERAEQAVDAARKLAVFFAISSFNSDSQKRNCLLTVYNYFLDIRFEIFV